MGTLGQSSNGPESPQGIKIDYLLPGHDLERERQLFVPCVCFAEISSPKMTLEGLGASVRWWGACLARAKH